MSPTNDDPLPARPPLDQAALRAAIIRPGALWQDLTVVTSTGSTNTDLAAQATRATQAPEGTILIAEEQRQGRGRMGRSWLSPPRSSLMFSVLLRPAEVPPARRGWIPLLAGVAAATAVRRVTNVPATLKWPNDLLVADRKLAGILAEQSGDAIVVGLGINVTTTQAELPQPAATPGALPATSLWLEHATSLDRAALLTELLGEFEHWYQAWRRADPPGDPETSGLRQAYLNLSATIGRDVRVERPGGRVTVGRATGLDPDGQLIVEGPALGREAVSAGDVRHLR
ncbi:MAG TPA: biotin--[acetyl-CoA-carboxylase] ligase [Streptosporangiaceae bacterium]|nr:biotin--[acetyl-CoA-carboxylase] ligase [Streptosporangiaceae bacterium]